MQKFIKWEIQRLSEELRNIDSKTAILFLSSTILIIISWYFANPKFFHQNVTFLHFEELIIEELIAHIYWFLLDFILFFLIPLYVIKFLFHNELKSYGFAFGDRGVGLILSMSSILIFIPIIYLIFHFEDFSQYFPLMQSAREDIMIFLIYECFFILFIFSWEFIFRGYMLFGLEKKFGIYAVFIQMIPFVLLHNGKPFLETFSSIFGALFLGYLALRTRSVIYGFLIHASILVALDILAFITYKTN